jgi:Tfp pilus assembly protein FimT
MALPEIGERADGTRMCAHAKQGGSAMLEANGSFGMRAKLVRLFRIEAFTIVECVVVLACAGVLLGAAVPCLHHWRQEWTVWSEARVLENSLRWGRNHAVSSNNSLTFWVDQNGRRFYWTDNASNDRYDNTVHNLPAGVRIVGAPRRPLRFFQEGNAVPAGTYILQGEAGFYRVVVNSRGRIRVTRSPSSE